MRGLKDSEKTHTIKTDKAPAYGVTISELKAEGKYGASSGQISVQIHILQLLSCASAASKNGFDAMGGGSTAAKSGKGGGGRTGKRDQLRDSDGLTKQSRFEAKRVGEVLMV